MTDCTPIIEQNIEQTEIELVTPQNTVQLSTQLSEVETNITSNELTNNIEQTTLETISQEVTIVVSGQQGPPGIPESELTYAERVDFVGTTLIYRGEATPGTLDSSPSWRIRRLTINPASDDDVTTEWADGVSSFTKVWDNRASLVYS